MSARQFKQLPSAARERHTRHKVEKTNADRHMLGVLRVKSYAHWMIVQVVRECECEQAMKARGETFETLDSVDSKV